MLNMLMGGAPSGYRIQRSLRLRASNSAYLSRTFGAGNRQTWTWSGWVKRGSLGVGQTLFGFANTAGSSGVYTQLVLNTSDNLELISFNNSAIEGRKISSAVYRDPSAWMHMMAVFDTTNSTAADRFRLYINGSRIASFGTSVDPSINYQGYVGSLGYPTSIGALQYTGFTNFFDGLLADVHFIDGQALDASYFGQTDPLTGAWSPKKYTGTFGTNGFHLDFSDNSAATATAIGKDSSGNGNNWTPNGSSVTAGASYDSLIDVPTTYADGGNGRGNYATGNPLNADGSTWSSSNLNFSIPNGTNNAQSGFSVTSGKWYWEVVYSAIPTQMGIQKASLTTRWTNGVLYSSDGNKYINGAASAYGAAYTSGDILGVALDMDGSTVTFYKNNVSQGSISLSGSGASDVVAAFAAGGGATSTGSIYFGQRPFTYTPPTGFKALNTSNLPDPTIKKPNQYFDATTFVGAAGGGIVVNSGFTPDLVWMKSRSAARNQELVDSVRGAAYTLFSNLTNAEASDTRISSFNSNGFTYSSTSNSANAGDALVAWQWKKSTAAGIDIVGYNGNGGTGASSQAVPHSLGVLPSMVIIMHRNTTGNHTVEHVGCSVGGKALILNGTGALSAAFPNEYRFDQRTSSTYQVGVVSGGSSTNGSGETFVMYLFAEIPGFSKFGSYPGNGSTDGPFVWCGFRPRFVMIKRTDSSFGGDWYMYDTARDTYNAMSAQTYANGAVVESSVIAFDAIANGFKVRSSAANFNASGGTYIFAAFAERPFKYANAR